MTDPEDGQPECVVLLRWTFCCYRCGDGWTEEQYVDGPGVDHAAPSVPNMCPKCDGRLAGLPHDWTARFEVMEVQTCE